jgi:hypothetical protein
MKKLVFAALISTAALTLSACGSSDSASDAAQADNVEMPAEETMTNVDASAAPASDAAALPGADASASPAADSSAAAPDAAAKAAEDATVAAEKKL